MILACSSSDEWWTSIQDPSLSSSSSSELHDSHSSVTATCWYMPNSLLRKIHHTISLNWFHLIACTFLYRSEPCESLIRTWTIADLWWLLKLIRWRIDESDLRNDVFDALFSMKADVCTICWSQIKWTFTRYNQSTAVITNIRTLLHEHWKIQKIFHSVFSK